MNTFTHEFPVIYNGRHYKLCSLSDHRKHKTPQGMARLYETRQYSTITVPMSEIHFQDRFPSLDDPVRSELRRRL